MEKENSIAIRLKNLCKSYTLYDSPMDRVREAISISGKRYGKEKVVLDHINLEIQKGDVLGILGTNGAGKSTLLKMITGVLCPTSGSVELEGKVSALLELGTGFNPEFTGLQNIFLNGTIMGFSREEMEEKLQGIVEFADIGEFIKQPVKTYSSGMFARLAFSVAVSVEPDILIVDETLSVGDLKFQMKCMDRMQQMMNNGVTVLFVSNDINAIRRLCNQAIWIKDGIVQLYDKTNVVCDRYLEYLKLGEEPEEANKTPYEEKRNGAECFVPKDKESVAEIVSVTFRNKNHEEKECFDLLEEMYVEVTYDVYDPDVEHPVLGVALKRIDEEYICGLNTLLDGKKIPWNYGRNRYTLCYTNGIRTLGGKYYVDVALLDKTATVSIHYWAKAKEFTVSAGYIGEGVCIIPHEWRK